MLVVGILNVGAPPKIVPGITTSSPDQCANPSVLAPECTIQTNNSQGVEHLEFKIGGILGNSPGLGNWILNITAALTTSNNTLVQSSVSSISFSITVSPMILTVQVPAGVAASIDGVKQPPGPVQVPISAGSHNMTVPVTMEFNNETRLEFSRWSDGFAVPNRTVKISASTTYEAIYLRQYQLRINGYANSALGQGWYDAGSNATVSVADTEPMSGYPWFTRRQTAIPSMVRREQVPDKLLRRHDRNGQTAHSDGYVASGLHNATYVPRCDNVCLDLILLHHPPPESRERSTPQSAKDKTSDLSLNS